MSETTAVTPDVIYDKPAEADDGCECGWRLPCDITANVRVKSLQLQFTCPICDTNFMMVIKGAK